MLARKVTFATICNLALDHLEALLSATTLHLSPKLDFHGGYSGLVLMLGRSHFNRHIFIRCNFTTLYEAAQPLSLSQNTDIC